MCVQGTLAATLLLGLLFVAFVLFLVCLWFVFSQGHEAEALYQ